MLRGSLDIQFRLLRADCFASLKAGIQLVLEDLDHNEKSQSQGEESFFKADNTVHRLINNGGGRFSGTPADGDQLWVWGIGFEVAD